MRRRVHTHPLLQALAGAPPQTSRAAPVEEKEPTDPQTTYHILDADSSQRHCLDAAARGESFVLIGPPGTGKSQTIANLIADHIAHGKKVLFVSDKMAALEVVYKRLCAPSALATTALSCTATRRTAAKSFKELACCFQETLDAATAAEPPTDFGVLKQRSDQLNRLRPTRCILQRAPMNKKCAGQVLAELLRWQEYADDSSSA